MSFIPNIIAGITGRGTSEIVANVTKFVDEVVDSKEEKGERDIRIQQIVGEQVASMASAANSQIEMYLKDTQDARDMNAKVQDSAKASWLSKNIAYMLDCVFVVSFICMLVMIFCKAVPQDNKELFYTGFGLLGGYVGTIINFHRGTSKSSEKKQEAMEQMIKNQ